MRDNQIRRCGSLVSLIERMLDRSVEEGFETKQIVVQIAWNIDNIDTWQKDDMDNLKG